MAERRIYIITEGQELPPQRTFSNLKKLVEESEYDLPSLEALHKRIQRARKRTGKSIIRLKDDQGNPLIIEVKDLE